MLINRRCIGTAVYLGGVPAILEKFSFSFLQMALYSQEYLCPQNTYINFDRSKVSYHAKARNELCQNMLGEWIFFSDSDHNPEPDLLARMLHLFNKYKLNVLVGLYHIKVYPHPPLIYVWKDDEKEHFALVASWEKTNAEIFKIDAAGGGCLLIRRNVIYRMITELENQPFDIIPPFSEDLSFFKRCQQLEIDVYLAPNIENPHLDVTEVPRGGEGIEEFARGEERNTKGYKV